MKYDFTHSQLIESLKMLKSGCSYLEIGAWLGGDHLSSKERRNFGLNIVRRAERMEKNLEEALEYKKAKETK